MNLDVLAVDLDADCFFVAGSMGEAKLVGRNSDSVLRRMEVGRIMAVSFRAFPGATTPCAIRVFESGGLHDHRWLHPIASYGPAVGR